MQNRLLLWTRFRFAAQLLTSSLLMSIPQSESYHKSRKCKFYSFSACIKKQESHFYVIPVLALNCEKMKADIQNGYFTLHFHYNNLSDSLLLLWLLVLSY